MRKCIECGSDLFGRADKKFCNDYCRNSHNNLQNRLKNESIRTTNKILLKNYKILQSLQTMKQPQIKKDALIAKGFDFNYFTRFEKQKSKTEVFYVYDIKYQIDDTLIHIN